MPSFFYLYSGQLDFGFYKQRLCTDYLRLSESFTARKIIDYLKENKINAMLKQLHLYKLRHKRDRTYQFWQEESHPVLIQYEKMMLQKLEYIPLQSCEKRRCG